MVNLVLRVAGEIKTWKTTAWGGGGGGGGGDWLLRLKGKRILYWLLELHMDVGQEETAMCGRKEKNRNKVNNIMK
ncbi:hypothetical protein RchiOBHm_Chr7g0194751 [Rosa chinensis]|uniref:Uncharacterized protein n=1 Tax=Rosa chinensis TaxID=74649 RepID=A0A2P6P648_ROSCH|nr:hypothetical protein RchiOBHm_Chr7g0194751 [Rosa chinensis]